MFSFLCFKICNNMFTYFSYLFSSFVDLTIVHVKFVVVFLCMITCLIIHCN